MRETGGVIEVRLEPVDLPTDCTTVIVTLKAGPYVRLTVRDTGHGMAPEILERIFEPFFTTKNVGEGTGMGLAVVHGIVTSNGGAITVESAPKQGATFAVYLPRLVDPTTSTVDIEEPLPGGRETLLFVDDEAALVPLWQAASNTWATVWSYARAVLRRWMSSMRRRRISTWSSRTIPCLP